MARKQGLQPQAAYGKIESGKRMTLEENVAQLHEALTLSTAMTLRHETRIKEHEQWIQANEQAYARHGEIMAEADEKINRLIDAMRRGGGNGHS